MITNGAYNEPRFSAFFFTALFCTSLAPDLPIPLGLGDQCLISTFFVAMVKRHRLNFIGDPDLLLS